MELLAVVALLALIAALALAGVGVDSRDNSNWKAS
jgi:Tfp pilus assembly protein FimT